MLSPHLSSVAHFNSTDVVNKNKLTIWSKVTGVHCENYDEYAEHNSFNFFQLDSTKENKQYSFFTKCIKVRLLWANPGYQTLSKNSLYF